MKIIINKYIIIFFSLSLSAMEVKLLFFFILLLIFKRAILEEDPYDFHKKGSFSLYSRNYAIFDPTGFKTNQEIYFELRANSFNKEELGYKFLNVLDDDFVTNIKNNLNYVSPQHKSKETTIVSSVAREIRNYAIKKSEGNYLILYFEYTGKIQIENTVKNKAIKNNLIEIIVPVVISVLAFAGFYYFYCRKKRCNKNNNNEAVVYNENTPNILNNQPYATYLPNSNMNNQSYNNNCLNMNKKKKKKNKKNNNMNQHMNNNINDNMKNNNDMNYCSNMANNNNNSINNNMMNNNNNSINSNMMNNNVIDQTNKLNQPYTSIPQSSNDHRTGYSSVQAS